MALALGAGLALRLWMLRDLFDVNGDMLIYGDLAKNLLLHGRYALTLPSGAIYSTLIRLPGYPLFLALCFKVFGMENYFAAACVQIALDLLGCLLLAGFVRRIVPAHGESGRRAGYTVAGGALSLYRLLYRGSACGNADALRVGAGDVGDGALPATIPDGRTRFGLRLRSPPPRCCGPMARWPPWLLCRLFLLVLDENGAGT